MSIPLTSTQILKRAYLILFFSVFALLYAGFTIFGCLGTSLEEEDERAGSKVRSPFLSLSLHPFLLRAHAYPFASIGRSNSLRR